MSHLVAINAETRLAISDLVAEVNRKLDTSAPQDFAALFTDDGSFKAAGKEHRGRSALQEFADVRTAQDKISRTFLGSHHLQRVSDEEIHGVLPYILFMASTAGPTTPDVFAVGEYVDVYRLEDGRWRLASRESKQVFSRPKP
ncbi:nuclear transport factor 2 family protein [Salinibacterium sp. ZJ450]|uniref:nuclear transport factor 2 family protein n=1 Tax=Salinibacterium sp. ZJ450 TaxID=2708338 RepID=UPI00142175D6|nr:nuclear transport factor 2 family protein [Salinibacterium sp. ZJ450]